MSSFEFFPRKEETTPFHFPGALATYEHVSPVSSSAIDSSLHNSSKFMCRLQMALPDIEANSETVLPEFGHPQRRACHEPYGWLRHS